MPSLREVSGVIMIEGVDAVGKTTLAQLLHRQSSHRALLHAGPPKTGNVVIEYVEPLHLAQNGWTVICDRWHLGELVWPVIFDRASLYEEDSGNVSFSWTEDYIRRLAVPLTAIYLERDERDIIKELEARGDDVDHISASLKLYDMAIAYSSFDWNRLTLPEVIDGAVLRQSR